MPESNLPSLSLLRTAGVAIIDEPAVVFREMLKGWATQQSSRQLSPNTISDRVRLMQRFGDFAEGYPWEWKPGDLEAFTTSVLSGRRPLAHSTVRGYHVSIRLFCDYITDLRYEWVDECLSRFGAAPTQICFDWNTILHVSTFEGRPGRRGFDYHELEQLFTLADEKVEWLATSGRKGALAALRDSQMLKTAYAFGLRRREVCRLELSDLRPNPEAAHWGNFGSIHVRYGKSSKGSPPKRRTIFAVPEFEFALEGLRSWVEQGRDRFRPGESKSLWPTERGTQVSVRYLDGRLAALRDEAGLPSDLTLHSFRHSYVTHLTEYGYSYRFIQDQVGHASAATLSNYTSVSDGYRNAIVKRALRNLYGKD